MGWTSTSFYLPQQQPLRVSLYNKKVADDGCPELVCANVEYNVGITQSVWPQHGWDYLAVRVQAKFWYLFKLLLWFHMWRVEVQIYPCSPKITPNHLIIKQLWGMTRQRNDVLLVVAASELALPCLNRLSQWYYMWRSTWSLPEGFQLLDHPKAAVLHKDSPFIHSFVSSMFHRMTVKFVLFVRPRWG